MKIKMTARRIFWLLLALIIALSFHYRQVGLDMADLGFKLGRLHWTKQKILEVQAGPDTVRIFIESYPKPIRIINANRLGIILKEAYGDYYLFLEKHYPQIFYDRPGGWHKKSENLDFIFVSSATHEALEKVIKRRDANAIYLVFFNVVYFKTFKDSDGEIDGIRTTIRHEIFHYLNNYYGLAAEFEEAAAQKFG